MLALALKQHKKSWLCLGRVLIVYVFYLIMTQGARAGLTQRSTHSTEVGPSGSRPVDNPPTSRLERSMTHTHTHTHKTSVQQDSIMNSIMKQEKSDPY